LKTYQQIEKRVNMYKPPNVVRSPDPPPKTKYSTKDWSLRSDTNEYQTTSSSGTSSSGSSDDEDAKPPPPSKVYLLKGIGRGRGGAPVDAESHITMDSGVTEYQNSLSSSPISTEYLRYKDPDINYPSPKHRRNLNEWYQANRKNRKTPMPIVKTLSTHMSASDDDVHTLHTLSSDEGALLGADLPNITKSPRNEFKMRQSIAYMAILLTVVQLLVLMLQVALCGAATWDVNPMFGPYPDAFSVWGGKNPYLMLHDDQWWRLITPSFLHVGFLHLLANAFCQLEAIALFEREWGSFRWVLVYVVSSVGCNAFSSLFDENTIAVGSSGALMGLYAAKLAQVCCAVFFDDSIGGIGATDDTIRLDQMSGVLCGLTIVSLLSSFTYIDWSGHMGGLMAGYLAGMVLFSCTIRRCCVWFLWSALGFLGLVAGLTATIYFFITTTHPYEELADPCEYFRSLFPEGYVCGCMWQ
jgi:membrane associated rhomboid family serine protease